MLPQSYTYRITYITIQSLRTLLVLSALHKFSSKPSDQFLTLISLTFLHSLTQLPLCPEKIGFLSFPLSSSSCLSTIVRPIPCNHRHYISIQIRLTCYMQQIHRVHEIYHRTPMNKFNANTPSTCVNIIKKFPNEVKYCQTAISLGQWAISSASSRSGSRTVKPAASCSDWTLPARRPSSTS